MEEDLGTCRAKLFTSKDGPGRRQGGRNQVVDKGLWGSVEEARREKPKLFMSG